MFDDGIQQLCISRQPIWAKISLSTIPTTCTYAINLRAHTYSMNWLSWYLHFSHVEEKEECHWIMCRGGERPRGVWSEIHKWRYWWVHEENTVLFLVQEFHVFCIACDPIWLHYKYEWMHFTQKLVTHFARSSPMGHWHMKPVEDRGVLTFCPNFCLASYIPRPMSPGPAQISRASSQVCM
jgi:hypothetical protein